MPINDKQRAFINEYLVNGHNATKAYRSAYPDSSPKACETNGHRLISNDKIKAEIDDKLAKVEEKYDSSRESLVKKLMTIVTDPTSTKKEITAAASLIGDFQGHKRDTAPNAEKVAEVLARMSAEEVHNRRIAARTRTSELTGPKLKENVA